MCYFCLHLDGIGVELEKIDCMTNDFWSKSIKNA